MSKRTAVLGFLVILFISSLSLFFSFSLYYKKNKSYYLENFFEVVQCGSNRGGSTEYNCGKNCEKCLFFVINKTSSIPNDYKSKNDSNSAKYYTDLYKVKDQSEIVAITQIDRLIGSNNECNCKLLNYFYKSYETY
jgi:hypothetical protein